MTYKVVQWGTGNLGKLAVQSILKHPDLELIGTWVSSSEKAGRDAGELCGVAPIGVTATQDADALINGDADCICYAADSMGRKEQVIADCVRMLAAGKNVVNVSDPALVYPKAKGGDVFDRLQQACQAGNASFYTSGGDPGWAGLDWLWRQSPSRSRSARSGCSRSTTTARGTTRSSAFTGSANPTRRRR